MTGHVFSPAAQADIEAIWNYTVEHWGLEQAELYVRAIQVACEELAAGTRFSRSAHDIRAGYRQAAVGSHILFFCEGDAGLLDVVRILHQRMDLNQHL